MLALGLGLGAAGGLALGDASAVPPPPPPPAPGPEPEARLDALIYLGSEASEGDGTVETLSAIETADPALIQTSAARQPTLTAGEMGFDGVNDLLEPGFAGPGATARTIALPDRASGSDPGAGFTCTGLHRLSDGRWALGNHGKATESSPGQAASIVILTEDFTAIDAEFLLSDYHGGTSSVQGVTQDATGTLWVAAKQAGLVIGLDPVTGAETGRITLSFDPNGLSWDSLRGELIVHDEAAARLRWLTAAGVETQSRSVPSGCDQIHFDADCGAEGTVWFSSGVNGNDGDVTLLDIATGTRDAFWRGFAGTDAAEGLFYDRAARRLYFASDGYFHNGTANRIFAYDVPPPLPARFALFWRGRGRDSSPGGTVAILAYGQNEFNVPTAAIYQKGGTRRAMLHVRAGATSAVAEFTTSDVTVDADYWVSVDLSAGTQGEATLFVDGNAVETVGFSTDPGRQVIAVSDGIYAGGVRDGSSGAAARYWDGVLRAVGVSFDPTLRTAIEGSPE